MFRLYRLGETGVVLMVGSLAAMNGVWVQPFLAAAVFAVGLLIGVRAVAARRGGLCCRCGRESEYAAGVVVDAKRKWPHEAPPPELIAELAERAARREPLFPTRRAG